MKGHRYCKFNELQRTLPEIATCLLPLRTLSLDCNWHPCLTTQQQPVSLVMTSYTCPTPKSCQTTEGAFYLTRYYCSDISYTKSNALIILPQSYILLQSLPSIKKWVAIMTNKCNMIRPTIDPL